MINQDVCEVIDDASFNITNKLFDRYLKDEILTLLSNNDNGLACASSSTLRKFVDKMRDAHNNSISCRSGIVQELFLLHQFCKSLYFYNDYVLGYSHREFRARVLFPNLVYSLIRFFHKAHGFLRTTIKAIFNEIRSQSYGIIQKHIQSYYLDEEIMKIDALYEFLGNALRKFNPTMLDNINYFYKQVFRNIFFWYLRKEHKIDKVYGSILDIDTNVAKFLNSPTRLSMYRDVLFELQVNKFCDKSHISHQLNYNYSIFKNVIIGNELQNIYLSSRGTTSSYKGNKYKLLKSCNIDDEVTKQIRSLPTIYKLLKCVHIVNPKSRPYNEKLFKPKVVKLAVLEELMVPFRNSFSDEYVYSILENISDNFTNSILSGEYINLFTLASVRINQISFITQVKKFVQICLSEVTE